MTTLLRYRDSYQPLSVSLGGKKRSRNEQSHGWQAPEWVTARREYFISSRPDAPKMFTLFFFYILLFTVDLWKFVVSLINLFLSLFMSPLHMKISWKRERKKFQISLMRLPPLVMWTLLFLLEKLWLYVVRVSTLHLWFFFKELASPLL